MPRPFEDQLETIRLQSLYRTLREIGSAQGSLIEFAGKELVNFSSNDYLGLASEPWLREIAKQAIDDFGVGAGASRLVCGTQSPHIRLEKNLTEFKHTEAALTFSSGYAASVGTLSALLEPGDVVILDKLAHASLIDGARLSGATLRVFPHNHLDKLEHLVEWARSSRPDARIVIVTESVFSMDGDRAPLMQIVEIKNRYDALLLLDEAHAIGVLGNHGRGLADEWGVAKEVEIQMGTLSKAIGVSGGYICGKQSLIDLLINKSRSFIYSTAPPPAIAATAAAAVDFLMSEAGEERRQKLWWNLNRFDQILGEDLPRSRLPQSAIIPILIGSAEIAMDASRTLLEMGFLVPAIRYPTVAKGTARLRVTLSALHTPEQIEEVVHALRTHICPFLGDNVLNISG